MVQTQGRRSGEQKPILELNSLDFSYNFRFNAFFVRLGK